MKPILFVSFSIILTSFIFPQSKFLENKFKLAQNYEYLQDWENAVKIYEELFKIDSLNIVYFDALIRGYDQLKRYDDAIRIVKIHLNVRSKDIGLLSLLGKMYARNGKTEEAVKSWESAIEIDKKNLGSYSIVANTMIESRMFDHAIKIYQQARDIIGDPYLFAADLGYLHSVTMNFTEATKEYLLLLQQSTGQLSFVQSRMSAFTGKQDGLNAALSVLETGQKNNPDNPSIMQLLAWLYMEAKQYDKALAVYKLLDSKIKAGGREVYNFAERALRDKVYSTAAKAFKEVVTSYPNFNNIAAAKFGYARTLEEGATLIDTLKLFGDVNPFMVSTSLYAKEADKFFPTYSEALIAYRKIISEFPLTEFAAKSLYRTALIYFYFFFDLDKTYEVLEQIEKSYSNYTSVLIESSFLMGNVYVVKDDLEKAFFKFKWLIDSRFTSSLIRDRANYALAEINFFRYNFKESLEKLNILTKNPVSEIANDAITLQIIIQENLENEKVLKMFADGMFLKKKRRFEQAAILFENTVKENPNSEIIDEALIQVGDIYSMQQQFEKAKEAYSRLIQDYPDNIMADKSQMKIATIYQFGLNNKMKAIEAYQLLLEKFPNSIYCSEARKKIRELRSNDL